MDNNNGYVIEKVQSHILLGEGIGESGDGDRQLIGGRDGGEWGWGQAIFKSDYMMDKIFQTRVKYTIKNKIKNIEL